MKIQNSQFRRMLTYRFLLATFLIGVAIGAIGFGNAGVLAQEEDYSPWAAPINISQSGAADRPHLVEDARGDIHVLWREDVVNSYYYAAKKNGRWDRPVPQELPFATLRYALDPVEGAAVPLYDPLLVADGTDRIHAFWLTDKSELYHSSVVVDEFENIDSWSERQLLGSSVLGLDAATDEDNQVHLTYVINAESAEVPAGIYYRRAELGDEIVWSEPTKVYLSAYFRSTDADDVNLRVATGSPSGNAPSVYVAFDNPALEEVLFVRSGNGGASWQSPFIIDQRLPDDEEDAVGPSGVDLIATADDLQIIWMAEHKAGCRLYHQRSEDDGRTWLPVNVIETRDGECPGDFRLLDSGDELQFLLSETSAGALLQAWNGAEWSNHETQEILAGFDDPVTHRSVTLGCQQAIVDEDADLLMIGCGESGENSDVWLIERPLGDQEAWFSNEPMVWSEPAALMETYGQISSPLILSGSDNLLHAFWVFDGRVIDPEAKANVFYSSWSGDTWSRQVPLLKLDTAEIDQLVGVFDPDSGPFLMWRDAATNTYMGSSVSSDRILFPADWSSPRPIFDAELLASRPMPFLGNDGLLHVVYAVPYNEGRGIYLMDSDDHGISWSDADRVVDAAAADWAMVDRPAISQSANGDMHVVFTVYSLVPDPAARALYYTQLADGEASWAEPTLIAEGDITWSRVIDGGGQSVLAVWQVRGENDMLQLWSRQSQDGGQNWERPVLLLDPDSRPSTHTLATEIPGQPYFVQVKSDSDGYLTLYERRWGGDAWLAIESHNLATRLEEANLSELAAAVSDDGRLMSLYNTTVTSPGEKNKTPRFAVVQPPANPGEEGPELEEGPPANGLYVTDRAIDFPDLPVVVETAAEMETAVSSAEVPAAESDLAAVSETVEEPESPVLDLQELPEGGEANSNLNRLLLSSAPVILIVLLVFVIGFVRLRLRG